MELPNFFLPDEPRQDYRRFRNPGDCFYDVVVDPIALLKPEFIAVDDIAKSHVAIDQSGDK